MTRNTWIKAAVSVVAGLLAVAHLLWPGLAIDWVTVALLVFAALPRLAPWLNSVELPGGVKLTWQDVARVQQEAEATGLLAGPAAFEACPREYSYQLVVDEDPRLALAGIRIEIEKRLNELAAAYDLEPRGGILHILRTLRQHEALEWQEAEVLGHVNRVLNMAVHGAELSPDAARLALDLGPRLLRVLDDRIEQARERPQPSRSSE